MLRATTRYILWVITTSLVLSLGCKPSSRTLLNRPKAHVIHAVAFDTPSTAPSLQGAEAPALLILRDLDGYTEPCGCTEDVLHGGIARLFGTLDALKASSSMPFLTLSAGNTLFPFATADAPLTSQDRARVQLLKDALQIADLRVHGVGPNDLSHGLELFEEFAKNASFSLVSTNVQLREGLPAIWVPVHIERLGGLSLAFLNIIHPSAFEGGGDGKTEIAQDLLIEDAHESLSDALHDPNVRRADVRVLFAHGAEEDIAEALQDMEGIDFVILRNDDEASDRVLTWDHTHALSVWSRGRAIGVLRLSAHDAAPSHAWTHARTKSNAALQEYRALIEHIEGQIEAIDARTAPGDSAPPMRATLLARKESYHKELEANEHAASPTDALAAREFLWDLLEITPDRPEHPAIGAARDRYNRTLQQINLQEATPPPTAAPNEASYIGAAHCAACHQPAHTFWQNTPHATAYATLERRDKAYDLECVGCHVTGYQQPGGASLGHTQGLENVQCESCHGPGSLHARAPTLHGQPQHILRDVDPQTCVSCHTSDHSTRFEDTVFRTQILGPGHGAPP